MKSLLHFIQYHNGTVLLVVLVMGFGGTVFAATELQRERPVSSDAERMAIESSDSESAASDVVPTPTESVDVGALLETDLDTFDMDLRIISADETDTGYLITYGFNTIALVEHAWQHVRTEQTLTVRKHDLAGSDINAYALRQLSEVVERERTYLKNVQAYERSYAQELRRSARLDGLTLDALSASEQQKRVFIEQREEPLPRRPVQQQAREHEVDDPAVDDADSDDKKDSAAENDNGDTLAAHSGSAEDDASPAADDEEELGEDATSTDETDAEAADEGASAPPESDDEGQDDSSAEEESVEEDATPADDEDAEPSDESD